MYVDPKDSKPDTLSLSMLETFFCEQNLPAAESKKHGNSARPIHSESMCMDFECVDSLSTEKFKIKAQFPWRSEMYGNAYPEIYEDLGERTDILEHQMESPADTPDVPGSSLETSTRSSDKIILPDYKGHPELNGEKGSPRQTLENITSHFELVSNFSKPFSSKGVQIEPGRIRKTIAVQTIPNPESAFFSKIFLSKSPLSKMPFQTGDESCKEAFAQKFSLLRHRWEHNQSENCFVCKICSRMFSNLSSLETHGRVAHINEKRYECEVCWRTFSQRSNWQRHVFSHYEPKFVS